MSDVILPAVDQAVEAVDSALASHSPKVAAEEIGKLTSVGEGVAWASGLSTVQYEELVMIDGRVPGMAMEILPHTVGIVMLGEGQVAAGMEVSRTGRIVDVPVGQGVFGRIIDPLGTPKDRKGAVAEEARWPMQREAPPIIQRAPVNKPMQTGLKVIDALFPIGRGQRELILGDRQTGKTAIALAAIMNQQPDDMLCVYCAVAQRASAVAKVVDDLDRHGALARTAVVAVDGEDPPGLQYLAPYAATSIGEYFMSKGRDVLIIYDDLTRHARAYRQLSLLLRRPPGREAFPGDIFYVHSGLLERSTRLKPEYGGGSLTALPIIETEAQNVSAYIPTNLISITDGQIYVSPMLFQKAVLPAVDVGLSVSRVGGKAQVPGYRKVASDLRLAYTQFQELETFARFGTRLDERTRKNLEHGQRVREVLKQDETDLLSAGEQVAILFAVSEGLLDEVPLNDMADAQSRLLEAAKARFGDLDAALNNVAKDDAVWDQLKDTLAKAVEPLVPGQD